LRPEDLGLSILGARGGLAGARDVVDRRLLGLVGEAVDGLGEAIGGTLVIPSDGGGWESLGAHDWTVPREGVWVIQAHLAYQGVPLWTEVIPATLWTCMASAHLTVDTGPAEGTSGIGGLAWMSDDDEVSRITADPDTAGGLGLRASVTMIRPLVAGGTVTVTSSGGGLDSTLERTIFGAYRLAGNWRNATHAG
jgi:hypothetical protein